MVGFRFPIGKGTICFLVVQVAQQNRAPERLRFLKLRPPQVTLEIGTSLDQTFTIFLGEIAQSFPTFLRIFSICL